MTLAVFFFADDTNPLYRTFFDSPTRHSDSVSAALGNFMNTALNAPTSKRKHLEAERERAARSPRSFFVHHPKATALTAKGSTTTPLPSRTEGSPRNSTLLQNGLAARPSSANARRKPAAGMTALLPRVVSGRLPVGHH